MEKWNKVELGEVGEVITGKTPSTNKKEYWNGNIPFVTPVELGFSESVKKSARYVTGNALTKQRIIPQNAILVCCIGSTIGKIGIAGRDLITNQQINSVIFDESKVYPQFGYYACSRLKTQMIHLGTSTTVPIMNKTQFSSLKIPLPPLPVQKKIAAILDAADQVRQKDKALVAKYDQLTRSLFLDMFGDTYKNQNNFSEVSLSNLIDSQRDISYGIVQRGEHVDDGIPVIRIRDVIVGKFDENDIVKTTKENSDKYKRTILKGNEILISIRGTVGKLTIAPSHTKGWNITREVAIIPVIGNINLTYLLNFLKSDGTQSKILGDVKGVAQSGVNLKDLRNLTIYCPPLPLQTQFAERVKAIEEQKQLAQRSLKKSRELFNSLLQKAFSGELVINC